MLWHLILTKNSLIKGKFSLDKNLSRVSMQQRVGKQNSKIFIMNACPNSIIHNRPHLVLTLIIKTAAII